MFNNKHVVAAFLIAPILAIISYVAVDHLVSERPHQAQKGAAYELIPKSNCRYESGLCDLENGDFKISITANQINADEFKLFLKTDHAIQGAGIAIANTDNPEPNAIAMQSSNSNLREWVTTMSIPLSTQQNGRLRIALTANETFYYAETGLVFLSQTNPH